MPEITFGRCTPILRVADLEASLAYYTGILGFSLDWRDRAFAQVKRGEAPLVRRSRRALEAATGR